MIIIFSNRYVYSLPIVSISFTGNVDFVSDDLKGAGLPSGLRADIGDKFSGVVSYLYEPLAQPINPPSPYNLAAYNTTFFCSIVFENFAIQTEYSSQSEIDYSEEARDGITFTNANGSFNTGETFADIDFGLFFGSSNGTAFDGIYPPPVINITSLDSGGFWLTMNQYETNLSGRFDTIDGSPCNNPVPEPATLFLVGAGLTGLVGTRFRRKKKR